MSSPQTDAPFATRRRPRRRHWLTFALLVLVVAGVVAFVAWYKLFRTVPAPYFADAEEHYKYGSIGNEANEGLPYWIWLVLPRVFPEHLPGNGGYAALGMVWE